MKYTTLTVMQLLSMSLCMAIISALLVCCFYLYLDFRLLPEVHVDKAGACIKVVNFENGHAFNCQDVNVLLRRYRTVTTQ